MLQAGSMSPHMQSKPYVVMSKGVCAGDMQPPLTVVLVNNGGGGIFSFLPIADSLAPEVFTPLWATPQNVDLAGVWSHSPSQRQLHS